MNERWFQIDHVFIQTSKRGIRLIAGEKPLDKGHELVPRVIWAIRKSGHLNHGILEMPGDALGVEVGLASVVVVHGGDVGASFRGDHLYGAFLESMF